MLKFLLTALLAYVLVRAAANLLRAIYGSGRVGPGAQQPRFGNEEAGRRRQQSTGSKGEASSSDRATRLRDEDDVEDARWEDL